MVRDVSATPQGRDARGPAPGGRARDPELDDAIVEAARTLLGERGVAGLTIEAIACRAGVARATVYRRWANRDALLLHFLRGLVREIPIPDRGHVRDDLVELLRDQLSFLESEAGTLYPSLSVQAGVDPAAGEALWDLVRHRRTALDTVLRRGIERHQIRADIDIELGLFLIWGPVHYRYLGALAGKAPIERDFIVKLVDSVLLGIGTAERAGPSPTSISAGTG
jgi:AcrR family transcriptional regulator